MNLAIWRAWSARLARERLLLVLLASWPPLWWLSRVPASTIPELVHWPTLATLAGLLLLSQGLVESGFLARAAHWLMRRAGNERRLALILVLFSAALSALVTNDVALFIVVPLTLLLGGHAPLPLARLVIFQALAVNAGSAISPIGNPQNLFLWKQADVSFFGFMAAMAPLVAALMGLLLALAALAFRPRALPSTLPRWAQPLDRRLGWLSLGLYLPFLLLVEAGLASAGLAALLVWLVLSRRPILTRVDWLLLLIFALMFINLGLLARLPMLAERVGAVVAGPEAVLLTAVGLSQLLSNVPAAIFLAAFTDDWRALAWGVSVGGFGLAIGSLANLIALRLAPLPGLFWRFHAWSLPLLLAALAVAWLLPGP